MDHWDFDSADEMGGGVALIAIGYIAVHIHAV